MRRFTTRTMRIAIATAIAIAVAIAPFLVGESRAELENQVFTSVANRLRMVVPRGWRATDQPSYPGLLLWMMRSQPQGEIVVTGQALTREMYCTWPIACRTSPEPLPTKYACALRFKLTAQRMRVGPVQAGPKDNVAAGLPSVWFEYDDGKRFLRQAIAIGDDRVVSLVLAAPTNDARANLVRSFEQALRSMRRLEEAEVSSATVPVDAGVPEGGLGAIQPPARVDPVGPCR